MTEYRVLGPLEVVDSGRHIALGGPKQRALLAVLLLHAGEVLSVDRLVDELWGDNPPATAAKMVQVLVSRLRGALDSGGAAASVIATRGSGYVLHASPGELDLERFEALVAAARAALPADPERAATILRDALALWRGAPLSDLQGEPIAQLAIPHLEELRLTAVEERVDADLTTGLAAELVPELRVLVSRHPLRERLQGQLMLALYRAGRQSEALDVYRHARMLLSEELGIDPSPGLQRLEAAILHQDPRLEAAGGARDRDRDQAPQSPLGPLPVKSPLDPTTPSPSRGAAKRRLRGQRLIGATSAVAVVSAVALLWSHVLGTQSGVPVQPNSLAEVVADSTSVISDTPMGSDPGPIAADAGIAWVASVRDRTITRVDLRSGRGLETFGLADVPTSLTVSDGFVWIGNGFAGTLSRIIAAYGQLSAPFFPGKTVRGLLAVAVSPGDVWVGLADDTILRLDPSSLRTKAIISVPAHPAAIAVQGDMLWATYLNRKDVTQINPISGMVTADIQFSGTPQAIAAGFGSLWVATDDGRLWRIDPTRPQVPTWTPVGLTPSALATGANAVWLSGRGGTVLERIDPGSMELVRTLDVGRPIAGVAVSGDMVLITAD